MNRADIRLTVTLPDIELGGLFEDNELLELENRMDLERILRSYKTEDSELAQAAKRIVRERIRP